MSAEYQSFRRHFSDLSDTIQNPKTLASRLYSADMLSRERRNNIRSLQLPVEQIGQLLDAVEGQIKLNSQNFYKFLEVLEEESTMCHLCDKMRSTCDQIKSHIPEPITQDPSLKKSAAIKSQYKVFLKDCYRQPLANDDKLLFSASKHYIKLAVVCIHSWMTRKKAEADEFIKMSLHGFDEEILHEKAPIALEDILKPAEDGKPVRCVVVQGAPGIGKSTLAWEVCHKWEELDSVKQYDLVVLVRLREKKAQEARARCLEDLLPCDASINIEELVVALGRGKGVLIVCDGFDELPREQQQKGSVYIDLLKGVLLPEATIIVTSRPSVSDSLLIHCQYNIDRYLEILGFTKEEIKHFAESIFSGDLLKGFLTYITSNPFIHAMMYVPLNAVIIALIYQDNYNENTPFPTTMTQLFDALTRALIRRHIVSMQSVPLQDFCMPPSLQCMEDINKLSPFVAQQLLELAKMAYESVHKKMYVFTNLGKDFEPLGLMKKTTRLNVCTGCECSYTFLHLTLQEYMAALYIAIVCPSGLGLYRKSIAFTTAYDVVLRFLAGLCRNHDVQSLCYHELVKILDQRGSALQLVRCAFECPSIVQTMKVNYAELDVMAISGVVAFDWYITGYCISHFDVKWDISIPYATEGCIDLLVKGLRSSPTTKGKIYTLTLSSEFSKIFTQLSEFCQLHSLILYCDIDDSHKEILHQLMITPGSELERIHVDSGCTASIMALLLSQSSLEELAITTTFLDIDQLRTELPPILPQRNSTLKKLAISGNVIELLATLLPNIVSMTHLEIVGEVRHSSMPVLITTVKSVHTLEVVKLTTDYTVQPHKIQRPMWHMESTLRHSRSRRNVFSSLFHDWPWEDYGHRIDLSELVEAAASNNQVKEVSLPRFVYLNLPQHIQTRHQQLLKCNDDIDYYT